MRNGPDRRAISSGKDALAQRVRTLMAGGEYMEAADLFFDDVLPNGPRWVVDTAALPEELAAKVIARQKVFESSPASLGPGCRADPSRDSTATAVFLLFPAMFLAVFVVVALAGGFTGPPAWAMIAAPCVIVLVSTGLLVRSYRGPLALTRTEARLVRQHTEDIDPIDIPLRIKQLEDALQIAALEVISAIGKSPAWKSEHCDLHRIQLNLTEEAYQVAQSCMNLRKLSDMIAEVRPAGASSSATRRQLESTVAEYETLYERAEDAVINRVAALYAYKSRLAGIETLISDIDKTSMLAQRSDDFAKMFEAIVRDEYAAVNTRKLAGELADLQAQLQTELAFISGHIIEAPALVAPLTRADKLDHRSGQSNTE